MMNVYIVHIVIFIREVSLTYYGWGVDGRQREHEQETQAGDIKHDDRVVGHELATLYCNN